MQNTFQPRSAAGNFSLPAAAERAAYWRNWHAAAENVKPADVGVAEPTFHVRSDPGIGYDRRVGDAPPRMRVGPPPGCRPRGNRAADESPCCHPACPSQPERTCQIPLARMRNAHVLSRVQAAPPQVWHGELVQTAPLLRSALSRLDGGAVLLVNGDGAPVTSGRLVVVMGMDGPLLPALTVEFSLRGITFVMEIPLAYVFTLVASWTGQHYVFRVPADGRLQIDWPYPPRNGDESVG